MVRTRRWGLLGACDKSALHSGFILVAFGRRALQLRHVSRRLTITLTTRTCMEASGTRGNRRNGVKAGNLLSARQSPNAAEKVTAASFSGTMGLPEPNFRHQY